MPGPLLQFPLVAGLQEAHDPKTAPPGTMTRLVNAAWTKDGRLDKRDGTKTVGATGAPTSAMRLFVRSGELCIVDGASLYSWSAELAQWVNRGSVPELALTAMTLSATVDGTQSSDIARLADGRIVHVWVTGDPTTAPPAAGRVYYEVLDADTGARTTTPTELSPGSDATMARIVTDGTNFAVVWGSTQGANIKCSINGSAVLSTLSTGANPIASSAIDACDTGNGFVISYELGAGGIQLRRFDYAALQQASVAVAGEAGAGFVSVSVNGRTAETLWIAYAFAANGGPVRIAEHNADTLASTTAHVNVDATANSVFRRVAVARIDATHAMLAYASNGQAGAVYSDGVTISVIVDNTGTLGATRRSYFKSLLTRPFAMNGKMYTFLSDAAQASPFASYGTAGFPAFPGVNTYLVECEQTVGSAGAPHRYVGLGDLFVSGIWSAGFVSNVVNVSATKALAVAPLQEQGEISPTGWSQGTRLFTIARGADMPADAYSAVEIQGEAYFAGAFLAAYDGRRPFDFGFPHPSFIDVLATGMSGGGSGGLGAGDYHWATVPQFRSVAGILHRGPGAPAIKLTAAASDKATVAVVPQTLSYKGVPLNPVGLGFDPLPVYLEMYRTTVGSGTLQRRSIEPTTAILRSSPTVAPNPFVDSASDNSLNLAAQPVIYNVGELDDYPPVSSVSLRLHRRRLFALSGDHRTIWYSKDYSENIGTAPGFNPGAILVGFDEDLVGMASLDDKFVAGSERAFYVFFGDGPAVNGDGGYDPPTKIATDVGFANPRAIVSTPDGVMFQSTRGIHLLTRDLQVVWIGRPVEDTVAAFPVITSAVLVSSKNQVRFTANAADGLTGCVIVYDYVRKQWSKFLYTDTVGAVASSPIADACIWDDLWTFVTPTGVVYTEDSSTALDGGATWVEEDIELSEIDSSGPLGYQRVRRIAMLGDRVSDCDVRMRIAVNGLPTYDQDHTFTSDVVATQGADLVRVVKTQQNTSIRLRVTDAAPTGPGGVVGAGRGVTLSAVGFEIVPLRGMQRRPAKAVA